MNNVTINEILSALNAHKIRATYGAIGGMLGIPPIGVGARLGDMRPEASWVVSAKNGRPSGYSERYCHPELYSFGVVIRTKDQLQALLTGNDFIADEVLPKKRVTKRASSINKPAVSPVRVFNEVVSEGDSLLMGIDLAWLSDKNGSGLAVGVLSGRELTVTDIYTAVIGYDNVANIIDSVPSLSGLAIDAPFIIQNYTGNRPCEKALNAEYSKKWAGCHPSNLERYPEASSVRLGLELLEKQFLHLGRPGQEKWQFECYPHPAIVELFGLEKRLAYKKGKLKDRREGQIQFARLIKTLEGRSSLSLNIREGLSYLVDEAFIASLQGQALKDNEDALDALVCLYIAGLYASGCAMHVFGDIDSGYIVVPSALTPA